LKVDFVLGHYPGIGSTFSFKPVIVTTAQLYKVVMHGSLSVPKSEVERINAAGANLIHLRAA